MVGVVQRGDNVGECAGGDDRDGRDGGGGVMHHVVKRKRPNGQNTRMSK